MGVCCGRFIESNPPDIRIRVTGDRTGTQATPVDLQLQPQFAALLAQGADDQVLGAQTELREIARAKGSQAHAPGVGAVDHHRTRTRADEFHAHEAGK
jgi:hypothetical protein